MQLEKLLHTQGFGTRRECRALVRDGKVSVGGTACDDPFAEFAPQDLAFSVDGMAWTAHTPAYVMLNKPAGVECSRRPQHHASVFSLLPPPLLVRGVQPVGRLDEDTTGLILLSDDGRFIHALSSPRRKVAKVYEVTTSEAIDATQEETLLAGVLLHGEREPVAASACERLGEKLLRLTISAGKYHQVKRMIAATGNHVAALRRTAIGQLELPTDLAPGAWRWLDAADLARLGYPK